MDGVNRKYKIDNFISNSNLLITEKEAFILSKYNLNYGTCSNLESLLFMIEGYLNTYELSDNEYDELDMVSKNISERNYYYTNK